MRNIRASNSECARWAMCESPLPPVPQVDIGARRTPRFRWLRAETGPPTIPTRGCIFRKRVQCVPQHLLCTRVAPQPDACHPAAAAPTCEREGSRRRAQTNKPACPICMRVKRASKSGRACRTTRENSWHPTSRVDMGAGRNREGPWLLTETAKPRRLLNMARVRTRARHRISGAATTHCRQNSAKMAGKCPWGHLPYVSKRDSVAATTRKSTPRTWRSGWRITVVHTRG